MICPLNYILSGIRPYWPTKTTGNFVPWYWTESFLRRVTDLQMSGFIGMTCNCRIDYYTSYGVICIQVIPFITLCHGTGGWLVTGRMLIHSPPKLHNLSNRQPRLITNLERRFFSPHPASFRSSVHRGPFPRDKQAWGWKWLLDFA